MRSRLSLALFGLLLVACNASNVAEVDELPVEPAGGLRVQGLSGTDLKNSKVSTALTLIAGAPSGGLVRPQAATAPIPGAFSFADFVPIDALSDAPETLLTKLQALGLRGGSIYEGVVSGRLPKGALGALNAIPELRFARPSVAKRNNAVSLRGKVTSQGVGAMRADVAADRFGATGGGIKVGVLSDSFNFYDADANGGPALTDAPADVASGDLPGNGVQVLEEAPAPGGADEGRAMAQIVHDVAPAASIAFATAFNGEAGFANNIKRLADAGSKVIVDDVVYLAEPYFQDGIIAQSVTNVSRRGISYFSSAGNQGKASYEAPFIPSKKDFLGCELHNFNAFRRVDGLQRYTLPARRALLIFLQWDEPFASVSRGGRGSTSDIDLFVLDDKGEVIPPNPDLGQFPISADNNLNKDPLEAVQYINYGNAPITVNIAITRCAGPAPLRMKYINFESGAPLEYDTQSGTLFGHANARGAAGIAASRYSTPLTLEPFSSRGGVPILRDLNGNRTLELRFQPRLTGPDGADTTFFYAPSGDPDNTGFPNFFGTSASAPHVAGVAAQVLGLRPNLPPEVVYGLLAATADNIGPGGYDFDSGFGFVRADRAVQALLSFRP
jgi:subtilisin family serine protease